jgi:hypothetical protein
MRSRLPATLAVDKCLQADFPNVRYGWWAQSVTATRYFLLEKERG